MKFFDVLLYFMSFLTFLVIIFSSMDIETYNYFIYGECIVGDFIKEKSKNLKLKEDSEGLIYEYGKNLSCYYNNSNSYNLKNPVDIYVDINNINKCYTCENIEGLKNYTGMFSFLLRLFFFVSLPVIMFSTFCTFILSVRS